MSDVDSTIRSVLDASLPDPYTVEIFKTKVQLVYDHVLSAYGDNGESAYATKVDIIGPSDMAVDTTASSMSTRSRKTLCGASWPIRPSPRRWPNNCSPPRDSHLRRDHLVVDAR